MHRRRSSDWWMESDQMTSNERMGMHEAEIAAGVGAGAVGPLRMRSCIAEILSINLLVFILNSGAVGCDMSNVYPLNGNSQPCESCVMGSWQTGGSHRQLGYHQRGGSTCHWHLDKKKGCSVVFCR